MSTSAERNSSTQLVDADLVTVTECTRNIKDCLEHSEFDNREIRHFFETLEELYQSPKATVRYKIVYNLAEIACPESVDFLKKALVYDRDPLIRHEAAACLGEIGDNSLTSFLCDRLDKDETDIVKHEVAMALDSVGDERALPIVTVSCQVAISSILLRSLQQSKSV